MATIYLLRHGQTQFNLEGRVQGSEVDSGLTALGEAQARTCGRILKQILADQPKPLFVSSPLGRAVATTKIVLDTLGWPTAPYATDPLIRELGMGRDAGLTADEVRTTFPEDVPLSHRDRGWNEAPPGGETDAELAHRAAVWFASVRTDTVAVSHRTFGRFLRAHVLGLDRDGLMALDEPHDCVFRIAADAVDRLTDVSE